MLRNMLFLLNRPWSQFSLVVALSVWGSMCPIARNRQLRQTVRDSNRVSVFCHKIDCISMFTELAHWADSMSKLLFPWVSVFVCATQKTCFLVDWRLLVKEHIANIGIPLDIFRIVIVFIIFCVLTFFWSFVSCWSSLLCIMGELAGGGSVALAVRVSG